MGEERPIIEYAPPPAVAKESLLFRIVVIGGIVLGAIVMVGCVLDYLRWH